MLQGNGMNQEGEVNLVGDRVAIGTSIVALAALLAAIAMALPSPAEAGGLKNCGDAVDVGAGSYDVRATKNVPCSEARRVARRFFPGGDDHFDKWRCEGKQLEGELGKAKCGRYAGPRRQVVKFLYGA